MPAEQPLTRHDMETAFPADQPSRIGLVRSLCIRTYRGGWRKCLGESCLQAAKLARNPGTVPVEARLARWLPQHTYRALRKEPLRLLPLRDEDAIDNEDPSEIAMGREDARLLRAAVADLPRENRIAIENAMLADRTLAQAATSTGLTVGKIHDRQRVAVNMLRMALSSMPLLAVVAIARPAHADVLTISTAAGSFAVETWAPLPEGFADAVDGNVITRATSGLVAGGGYFAGGFTYLAPIATTDLPQDAWSFGVSTGNAAEWFVNIAPEEWTGETILGRIISGFEFLSSIVDSDRAPSERMDLLGPVSLPLDVDGLPYVTTVRPTPMPAPATLLLMIPVSILLLRRPQ